jgi:hypothetical protein
MTVDYNEVNTQRRFMRHPAAIPIACRRLGHSDDMTSSLRDASLGGLSFVSDRLFAEEDILDVSFPVRMAEASFRVIVVWRHDLAGGGVGTHAYGVRFCHARVFPRARVLEQICHIEAYQKSQQVQHHRRLSSSRAAAEWIKKHAAHFPR